MLPTTCEVGMGLLPLIYSAGKKCLGRFSDLPNITKWVIKPVICPDACVIHVQLPLLLWPWAPPSPTVPSLVNLHYSGPGHISVGDIKGKERVLWWVDFWLEGDRRHPVSESKSRHGNSSLRQHLSPPQQHWKYHLCPLSEKYTFLVLNSMIFQSWPTLRMTWEDFF